MPRGRPANFCLAGSLVPFLRIRGSSRTTRRRNETGNVVSGPDRIAEACIAGGPQLKLKNAAASPTDLDALAYNHAPSVSPNSDNAPTGARRITLEEAQQMAAGASNPLVRLGQLQVEIAKQHRLGVQSQYFPSISTTFLNNHLNKQTGQVLSIRRPIAGGLISIPVNIIAKNQTLFNANATQPVTPLFAIYQLVKIARADENIAKAKVGMPVAEAANRVEKNYFDLLVAERELITAQSEAKKIQAKWLTASNSGSPRISAEQEADMLAAEKTVSLPASKVRVLTASLLGMVGLPEGTKLVLVPPEPFVEDVSFEEVAAKAEAANPEVVEAEQTAVKAHSGLKLSKMAYFPTVAIVGGYANQNLVSNAVLPTDFSYIGVLGTQARAWSERGQGASPSGRPCGAIDQGQSGAGSQEQLSRTGTLAQTQSTGAPDGVRDSSD